MELDTKSGTIFMKGFFTTQKYLQGRTLYQIEKLLGLHERRLSKGAWFCAATMLPGTNDFELAGYSQVAGHHTKDQYGSINDPKNLSEKNAYESQKKNVIGSWKLYGWQRLIKVIPEINYDGSLTNDYQYPPGAGTPQWKMIREIPCRAICFIKDYPNGKFIPDEGYKEIKYK